MPLIDCEILLQLKWSRNCIIVAVTAYNQNPIFHINDTKFYVPVVGLSTQGNLKPLKQLEPGFKRTINWNKYLAETTNQTRSRYLNFLIDPSLQAVNRLFILSFKDDDDQESHKQYYHPAVEIYIFFFDQLIKNDLKTYDNIQKNSTCQEDDYKNSCFARLSLFQKYYKLIVVDVSKQQKLWS